MYHFLVVILNNDKKIDEKKTLNSYRVLLIYSSGGGPGIGNWIAYDSTRFRTSSIFACQSSFATASLYCFRVHLPNDDEISHVNMIASTMNSTTFSTSFSKKLREVNAGVPMRIPPGRKALLSPGTVLRLTEKKHIWYILCLSSV